MKKLYFFLMATIFGTQALAQIPGTTAAVNYYFEDTFRVPGGMVFTTHPLGDSSMFIASTTTLVEKFPDKERGLTMQMYAGMGLANLKRTIGGGVDIGVVTSDFNKEKTKLSYAVWGYAQTNNGRWQLWFIAMKTGYFVEVWRCVNFITTKKCENFIGITNFEGNFALTFKTYLVKQKFYAFAGYAVKAYEEEHTDRGVEYKSPHQPLRHPGGHIEIGYEIPLKNKACKECNEL